MRRRVCHFSWTYIGIVLAPPETRTKAARAEIRAARGLIVAIRYLSKSVNSFSISLRDYVH
jgi:hypothetical protein